MLFIKSFIVGLILTIGSVSFSADLAGKYEGVVFSAVGIITQTPCAVDISYNPENTRMYVKLDNDENYYKNEVTFNIVETDYLKHQTYAASTWVATYETMTILNEELIILSRTVYWGAIVYNTICGNLKKK